MPLYKIAVVSHVAVFTVISHFDCSKCVVFVFSHDFGLRSLHNDHQKLENLMIFIFESKGNLAGWPISAGTIDDKTLCPT